MQTLITCCTFSVKIDFVLANSADPDEMLHYAAFHLGLHCLSHYAAFHMGLHCLSKYSYSGVSARNHNASLKLR